MDTSLPIGDLRFFALGDNVMCKCHLLYVAQYLYTSTVRMVYLFKVHFQNVKVSPNRRGLALPSVFLKPWMLMGLDFPNVSARPYRTFFREQSYWLLRGSYWTGWAGLGSFRWESLGLTNGVKQASSRRT